MQLPDSPQARPLTGQPCPCGSGTSYDECCRPVHQGKRLAETAEQLMRSRYSAYAVGDLDYVFRTWHPRTRPDDVTQAPGLRWTRLEILRATEDTVEFRAHHANPDGVLHETSRFERRVGRWLYVDGDVG